ncbi:MAG: T9SS type A sorting domain-containing protein [Saprospiraceae bacterium]
MFFTFKRSTDLLVHQLRSIQLCLWLAIGLSLTTAPLLSGQSGDLFTPAASFSKENHIVSTSFFHWFASTGGQLSGPWMPLEGRENWTGLTDWWKTQIKQVMMANIDVINVHLIDDAEIRRVLLFRALHELRREGYDIPKVAPFLDPLVTWYEEPKINLATSAGKDTLSAQYIRFYNQYFNENPDDYAADYLAKIDNRLVLDTWHVFLNFDNVSSLQRGDLESRLKTAFGNQYSAFNNGIYMITTALNVPVFSFADEKIAQFEINEYYYEVTHNNIKTAQLKAGYWDQNVRNPGSFEPRNGGSHYRDAWNMVGSDVKRIYIESWNEYDEGTGIYAGDVGAPYLKPGSGNTNTDVWSSTNDPYEYIHTTAAGAAKFNDYPDTDAKVLTHSLPSTLNLNANVTASVTIRNAGNESWTGAAGFRLVQLPTDAFLFLNGGVLIGDTSNEIPTYGGIFRGRPITFEVNLKAPAVDGNYETHWQMMKGNEPFGEVITHTIQVGMPTSSEDIQKRGEWVVAPNPTSDRIRIHWDQQQVNGQIALFDIAGRMVYGQRTIANGTNITLGQPAGVYTLVLTLDGIPHAQKLIIK